MAERADTSLTERICNAMVEVDLGGPVAAYWVLNGWYARVKHFGPAFFSKLPLNELSAHEWKADERWDSAKYASCPRRYGGV
ncbi:hypothetical protein [Streptomyces sp. NPDC001388]|uniref:hypothetical protein n=1 Tax=Streptomyces sp. NPDC001388 TaxID=3364568 RepID=UPI0036C187BE